MTVEINLQKKAGGTAKVALGTWPCTSSAFTYSGTRMPFVRGLNRALREIVNRKLAAQDGETGKTYFLVGP